MCGIIGYVGKQNATNMLLHGLKKLEYRGYDSSGIAIIDSYNNFQIIKSIGKISELEFKINNNTIQKNNIGIGHTRWATHGIPNEVNAHPHECGDVILVHNGIIENYIEIKQELEKENVEFYTQTDTEVACAYINFIYSKEKDKIKCIKEATKHFKGSYALSIIFKDDINTIYATRLNSPLVIGISKDENFVSSDVSAFLKFTNKYILLNHLEYAKVSKDNVTIYNDNLEIIQNTINIANWSESEYEKSGYDHFMLKEIYEQPKVLKNIFNRYENEFKDIDISKYSNIHIVACGSAMHAGLIGKYLIENYLNIPVNVEIASEYRYKNTLINNNTLVIILSQSGETADTLAALKIAKEKNATTLAIVNVVGSSISREADKTIYTYAGPEIAVATTKGYTSQVAILISLILNKINDQKVLNELNNIDNILTNSVLNKIEEFKDIADKIYNKNDIFFIGRGIDYATCMEGSLKLKEISYIHSEAYPAGELKHGTISLIEDFTPVIAIATDKNIYEKTISNIKETKARGAYVIFITTEEFDTTDKFYDIKLVLPKTSNISSSLIVIPALQLISYYTAKNKNCDIDKPKNLAKSVTVE
jgi:glutamine---fructose-6-phosphate transaminase (isomerizing)